MTCVSCKVVAVRYTQRITTSYVIRGSKYHGNDWLEQCDDISDAVTSLRFYAEG
jgi:hypothetical protein